MHQVHESPGSQVFHGGCRRFIIESQGLKHVVKGEVGDLGGLEFPEEGLAASELGILLVESEFRFGLGGGEKGWWGVEGLLMDS